MRTRKHSLLASLISLLLCVSMLLGSTWAWFTDSVTSSANVISTGTLKVELWHTSNAHPAPTQVTEATKDLFAVELWEPGVATYENFTVKSVGSLWLQYKLGLNPVDVNYVTGDTQFRLSDALKAGVIPGGVKDADGDGTVTREEAVGQVTEWKAMNLVLEEGALAPSGKTGTVTGSPVTDTTECGIVIWWEPTDKDNNWNVNNGKTTSDGNPLTIDVGVTLAATQFTAEFDSFGPDYDTTAQFPKLELPVKVTVNVTNENDLTAQAVTMTTRDVKATVPAGVQLVPGTQALTLSVTELAQTGANVTTGATEDMVSMDVHIEGVAEGNTAPIIVELGPVMPKYLNMGNYRLYHVEDGNTVPMTMVSSLAELDQHNEFVYDTNTGSLTVAMASFSEVAMVANTENIWNGGRDYNWYKSTQSVFSIANADQLAGLSAIVGGMAGRTADDFAGKTVKLIADINIGDLTDEDGRDVVFYPIGYYNDEGTYVKSEKAIVSGFLPFKGTFDGQGHAVKNFYQNTWEMKGDNNYYPASEQRYRDGMGLFGKVYGGTVKNLVVDNFQSDGEYTTTGAVAAYADGATFENISIFNCNPRVYNIGNGGIVGCVGWYAKDADLKTTFRNITVDNSNKISALWGSYDVACGGIVGQYYPTSGQSSANYPKNAGIHLENCHVSAQMDVYNDVCGNYQYYAYRYAGMMIGSIRENTTNDDGKTIPDMNGITAKGCTVNYGDWNDYYYCEFVKNGHPSYSGPDDYKFSRVDKSEIVFDENGNAVGCTHDHSEVEDNRAVYLPFHQLFTGYGWGVNSIGLKEYSGIVTDQDITEGGQEESVVKFAKADTAQESYNAGTTVTIGELFKALEVSASAAIQSDKVQVTVTPADDTSTAAGEYTADADWTKGQLTFWGKGAAVVTISDYYFCTPTTLNVTVNLDTTGVVLYSMHDPDLSGENTAPFIVVKKGSSNFELGSTFYYDVSKVRCSSTDACAGSCEGIFAFSDGVLNHIANKASVGLHNLIIDWNGDTMVTFDAHYAKVHLGENGHNMACFSYCELNSNGGVSGKPASERLDAVVTDETIIMGEYSTAKELHEAVLSGQYDIIVDVYQSSDSGPAEFVYVRSVSAVNTERPNYVPATGEIICLFKGQGQEYGSMRFVRPRWSSAYVYDNGFTFGASNQKKVAFHYPVVKSVENAKFAYPGFYQVVRTEGYSAIGFEEVSTVEVVTKDNLETKKSEWKDAEWLGGAINQNIDSFASIENQLNNPTQAANSDAAMMQTTQVNVSVYKAPNGVTYLCGHSRVRVEVNS